MSITFYSSRFNKSFPLSPKSGRSQSVRGCQEWPEKVESELPSEVRPFLTPTQWFKRNHSWTRLLWRRIELEKWPESESLCEIVKFHSREYRCVKQFFSLFFTFIRTLSSAFSLRNRRQLLALMSPGGRPRSRASFSPLLFLDPLCRPLFGPSYTEWKRKAANGSVQSGHQQHGLADSLLFRLSWLFHNWLHSGCSNCTHLIRFYFHTRYFSVAHD